MKNTRGGEQGNGKASGGSGGDEHGQEKPMTELEGMAMMIDVLERRPVMRELVRLKLNALGPNDGYPAGTDFDKEMALTRIRLAMQGPACDSAYAESLADRVERRFCGGTA